LKSTLYRNKESKHHEYNRKNQESRIRKTPNVDVVKLKEKLAVFKETAKWAYEQVDLVHMLEVKRLERASPGGFVSLKLLRRRCGCTTKRRRRGILHKAWNALTPTDLLSLQVSILDKLLPGLSN